LFWLGLAIQFTILFRSLATSTILDPYRRARSKPVLTGPMTGPQRFFQLQWP